MPQRIDDGRIVASVGDRVLRLGELKTLLPQGVEGQDSLDFATLSIDRWVMRQIKIAEAERIFSASVGDIEAMVRDYRQSLLTHRLDQYYIDESKESPFDESEIKLFYNRNQDHFILDKPYVKGVIVKIPESYREIKSLRAMMQKRDKDSRLNLFSICDRIEGCEVYDLNSYWIEYDKFLSHLPLVRGESTKVYMKRDGVQSLSDDSNIYLFEIEGYRSKGYVAPLEVVRGDVERILTTEYQQRLIREREQRLYNVAKRTHQIKIYE